MALEYKIFSSPTGGEIIISENSQYNEIKADKVVIHPNVVARLYGHVKDVTLKEGSLLYMHGRIIGNVVNEGGEIHIFNQGAY